MIQRIAQYIMVALSILVVIVAAVVVRNTPVNELPSILGYSAAVVVSGSMEEAIHVGDVVIIKNDGSYKTGDVITYHDSERFITHRIIAESDAAFITKGDNNDSPDREPVTPDMIRGRVVFRIPKVGIFLQKVRTPVGAFLFTGIALLLFWCPVLIEEDEDGKE